MHGPVRASHRSSRAHRPRSLSRLLLSILLPAVSLVALPLIISGCGEAAALEPLPEVRVIGGPGKASGLFHQPRGVASLPGGTCVIIDRSGRVQCFDRDGRVIETWRMPEYTDGQPIDCTGTPWGTLLVADTHYARLIEFSPAGEELRRFGEECGLEGVRGVTVGHDETIYVADYGTLDRIHRFARDGAYLGTFGSRGDGAGEFLRPEGLAIGANGDLYVVDCGHHRVARFRPDGSFVDSFGELGDEGGQFRFPMDITAAPDGSLYVVDFQGNRVQRFSADGAFLGGFGGAGTDPGRLATPRGLEVVVESAGHRVTIADTNNHRVQTFLWPGTAGGRETG